MCKYSRADFTSSALIQDEKNDMEATADFVASPIDEIPAFLRAAKANNSTGTGSFCELTFTGRPDTILETKKITFLKRFLLNLIKNAIQAAATQVEISFLEEKKHFICEVTDNGKGLSPELASNFFSRGMPQKRGEHQKTSVESNRLVLVKKLLNHCFVICLG